MEWVVLDVVDDGGMVGVSTVGFKGFVAFCVCCQIPDGVSGL